MKSRPLYRSGNRFQLQEQKRVEKQHTNLHREIGEQPLKRVSYSGIKHFTDLWSFALILAIQAWISASEKSISPG